jgi:hypothetical protein
MNTLRKKLILTGGVVLTATGLFHASFWLNPSWDSEFSKIAVEMDSLVQMLNLGVITFLISLGVIFVFLRNEVAASRLGRALLCAAALFFAVRLVAGGIFRHGNLVITGVLALCILLYLAPALMKEK